MEDKIIDVDSVEQLQKSMLRYTLYVSRKRVTPEYRDGLKPVQRAILYCMYAVNKCIDDSSISKCADIVGRTMGSFHPHGDSSIYGALVSMTTPFNCKSPLVTPSGNFGTIAGAPPAAYRYTEAYLSPFAMDCAIADLKETNNIVDWHKTYNEKTNEPDYLPAKLPLLLINGSFGIGVGMKVEIPSHNINEVIDAACKLLQNPNASIELIPDHCLPCDIINTNFKAIGNKGEGKYTVRSIIDIEDYKGINKSYNGRQCLVIKSTPNLTFLDSIMEKIESLVEKKVLIQIQDIESDSTEDAIRCIIVLKKGSDPEYVKQVLYKNTDLEKTERINFEVLDGIEPMRMSYKSYLIAFNEFLKIQKFRLYCNRYQKVQTRMHQIEAFVKIGHSDDIDEIIDMIRHRKSNNGQDIVEYLIKKLNITDMQANFILDLKIRNLDIDYFNKYVEEFNRLSEIAKTYMMMIQNDDLIIDEIYNEYQMYKKKYGRKRICKVISESEASGIPEGEFKVVVTNNNYIKKVQLNDNISLRSGDTPRCILKVNNTSNILLFDERGKVYKLAVHKIPFTDKSSSGMDIRMLVRGLTSNIATIIYEDTLKRFAEKQNKYFLVVLTAMGYIKKMDLDDFLTVAPSGLIYAKLDESDTVIDIQIINQNSDVIVYSDNKALRMPTDDISYLKRATRGSIAMNTKDKIDGLSVIAKNTSDIVVVTNSGRINRFTQAALPKSSRGKAGSKVIKLGKTDSIKSIYGVEDTDHIRIIGNAGASEIPVIDIPAGSSISQGTKMIPTKSDTIIRCDIIKHKKG